MPLDINKLGINGTSVHDNKSNIEYIEPKNYNYKIICKNCKQEFYRQRLSRNFIKKYRCIKCRGTFEVIKL